MRTKQHNVSKIPDTEQTCDKWLLLLLQISMFLTRPHSQWGEVGPWTSYFRIVPRFVLNDHHGNL